MSPSSPEIWRITIQESKQCPDRGEKVHFLDVRGVPDEYQIKGSVCYEPIAILRAERIELSIPKDTLIIPY